MTEHWKKTPRKTADIIRNQDFYQITTMSIGMLGFPEPNMPFQVFGLDVTDEEIGRRIRDALAASRMVSMDEFQEIWRNKDQMITKRSAEFNDLLMKQYGYKNRRELYRNMDICGVTLREGKIEVQPTHQKALDGSYTVKKDTGPFAQYISETASDAELGAAIREGFSRCTSAVR